MPKSGKFTEKLSLKKKLRKVQEGLGKPDFKSPMSSWLMCSCTGVMGSASRQKSRHLELGFHASLKNTSATEYEGTVRPLLVRPSSVIVL